MPASNQQCREEEEEEKEDEEKEELIHRNRKRARQLKTWEERGAGGERSTC